jgi:carbon monoxide dehydrogenase subunit G
MGKAAHPFLTDDARKTYWANAWELAVVHAATRVEGNRKQFYSLRLAAVTSAIIVPSLVGLNLSGTYPGAMARISGRIRIAAPVERVFDTAADSRNEPSFNPAMTGVELLTPLPIGLGTRFRARMGKAGGEMLVELTEFERPHRLSSRTASSMMETTGGLTFAAEGDGTVMTWDWQVRPKGWMRMLGPLVAALGGRMERRIWTGLKNQLEDAGSARSA